MSDWLLRGRRSDCALRSSRVVLFTLIVVGLGAVSLLGGHLVLFAVESRAPAQPNPVDVKIVTRPAGGTLVIWRGGDDPGHDHPGQDPGPSGPGIRLPAGCRGRSALLEAEPHRAPARGPVLASPPHRARD